VFTRVRHWTLSWARWNQSTPSNPLSLRSLHLRLCVPSGFYEGSIWLLSFCSQEWVGLLWEVTVFSNSHRAVILKGVARNVLVEWLALLLRIREFPGQISARRPATLTEFFRGCPQSLQANSGIAPSIRPRPLPSISYPIHYSLSSSHSMLRLSYWKRR
jgi:hypothetical protein